MPLFDARRASPSLLAAAPLAFADTYPDRPITFVLPFPAGGSVDVFGRAVATMEALGCQPDPWRIDAFRLERSGP